MPQPDEPQNVAVKRQRTAGPSSASASLPAKVISEGDAELVHAQPTPNSTSTRENFAATAMASAKPLKGRKRFVADLDEAVARVLGDGFEVDGLKVDNLENGEDEGSIVCHIVNSIDDRHVVTLTLMVSDTSEYPGSHNFLCFAQDESVPANVLEVIEGCADMGSKTISDMLTKLLTSLSKKMSVKRTHGLMTPSGASDNESEGEQNETDDESMYDSGSENDYGQYGLTASRSVPDVSFSAMQRDFTEVAAAGYRPGLTRIGKSEMVLSVSLPAFKLAERISTRALAAWDSRLLSSSGHFTLVIAGLRDKYPVLASDGSLAKDAIARGTAGLRFRVGLTPAYKPSEEQVLELVRTFGLKDRKPPPDQQAPVWGVAGGEAVEDEEEEHREEEGFRFSMSASLESLLDDRFLDLLQLRLKYSISWAAAEVLLSKVHRLQRSAEDILHEHSMEILSADEEEHELARSYRLPPDPLASRTNPEQLNLPLLAFSYLLRRLTLCPRYCLVCYDKLNTDFQSLKPYVCSDKLCTYQYYNLNRGPSLEYEICSRPQTVDLLVSLAFIAAAEGGLSDFPDGMNLQVPVSGELVDFDSLSAERKRRVITELLNTLPSINDMRKHLLRKTHAGRARPQLQEINPNVLPAAWLILRWCVASCTAHLEELTDDEDKVINIDATEYRQFRFTVGAPDAEARFHAAQQQASQMDPNANRYPSLFAWHGSPAKNWHSIIRHGLWFKDIAHGRAYGNGVYFAKDGTVSISGYARGAHTAWDNSDIHVRSCVALAEIVNLPHQFVSFHPYFVVAQTDWILCRYLLVSCITNVEELKETKPSTLPTVQLDPRHPITLGQKQVAIPEASHRLERLLEQRKAEFVDTDYDATDAAIFNGRDPDSTVYPDAPAGGAGAEVPRPADDWVHDAAWVERCVQNVLPPPEDASPMAVSAVQRELAAMLREQERAPSLRELGWYLPPDFVGDNLFQWIVELHSFEPELPVAQDMAARGVNSLVFEVMFPPNFPHSPPFFRILQPRFLPFIQGGGGHVTGGGSMCMDLLTADGWLPSYSVSAILLQIKLAISNLDPRPARLAANWNVPYNMQEALQGYRRAATTHGWRVPDTINRLAMY